MNKGQFIDTDYYYDSIIKTPINYIISKTKTSADDIIESYYDKIETDNLICYICYITDNVKFISPDKLILLRLCKQISSNIYKIVFAKKQTIVSSNYYFNLDISIPSVSTIIIKSTDSKISINDAQIDPASPLTISNNQIGNLVLNDLSNIKISGNIESISLKYAANTLDSIIPVEHLGKICLYSEYRGIYFEPIKKE